MRQSTFFRLSIPLSIAILAACSTKDYVVRTNKEGGYQGSVGKVLISITTDGALSTAESERFEKSLLNLVEQKFQSYCVNTASTRVSNVELNQGETLRKAIASFLPNQVLEISRKSSNIITGQNFSVPYGTWHFALTDLEQKRVIWRAELNSRLLSPQEQIEAAATEFVAKMRTDGVLIDRCQNKR